MIVGIVGYRGAGKSTVADALVFRHGFTKVSPIDSVKRLAYSLGFTHDSLWGSSSQRQAPHPTLTRPDGSPLTARAFLDEMSVAVRRLCPSILIAEAMRSTGRRLVNESVRLHLEVDAIKAAGGKLIKRRGGQYIGDEYDREVAEMDDGLFDAILPQCDSLDQLHQIVDTLIWSWTASESEPKPRVQPLVNLSSEQIAEFVKMTQGEGW